MEGGVRHENARKALAAQAGGAAVPQRKGGLAPGGLLRRRSGLDLWVRAGRYAGGLCRLRRLVLRAGGFHRVDGPRWAAGMAAGVRPASGGMVAS